MSGFRNLRRVLYVSPHFQFRVWWRREWDREPECLGSNPIGCTILSKFSTMSLSYAPIYQMWRILMPAHENIVRIKWINIWINIDKCPRKVHALEIVSSCPLPTSSQSKACWQKIIIVPSSIFILLGSIIPFLASTGTHTHTHTHQIHKTRIRLRFHISW